MSVSLTAFFESCARHGGAPQRLYEGNSVEFIYSAPDVMPWIWLSVFVICLIIEGVTFTLTTVWAAIASFPLIFLSRTALPLRWQILIFALLTLALVIFTRPFAVKKLKKSVKTNVLSLPGKEAAVTKDITMYEKGLVRLSNGTEWQALSVSGTIKAGTRCLIERVEGNTLFVAKPQPKQNNGGK